MKCTVKYYLVAVFVAMAFSIHAQQMHVPLGGNAWVNTPVKKNVPVITDSGLINWQQPEATISTYIYVAKKGSLNIAAWMNVPKGKSSIKCSINGVDKTFIVTGGSKQYNIGNWNIDKMGYVKIDLQGVSKTGKLFANIKELLIGGNAVNDSIAFVKNNDGNYFYWGRRGPSVHLNYVLPDTANNIEWFYNEVTVPVGNDVIGSFFMANGFGEGYFGMQVNSKRERRILFSVWSPFETDDPSSIPADKKINLVKKGQDVYSGEFGNEGSGGQSFLRYNWKAGSTYKFLLRAKPVGNNYTNYTAYFYATDVQKWLLIASFNRPATHTYLTRLHSFLENFEPETGNLTRKALYHNQWIKTNYGEWKPLSRAIFTFDETARKGFRLDYSGGVIGDKFYLQNAGFFNDRVPQKSILSIVPAASMPDVKLDSIQDL